MNTLFAKLFLWFWLAMVLIGGALLVTQHQLQLRQGLPTAETLAMHAAEMERLYRDEGLGALAGYVRALNRDAGVRVMLVLPRGRILPMHRMDPEMRRQLLEIARGGHAGMHTLEHRRVRTHPVMLGESRAALIAMAHARGLQELPWWARLAVALVVTALLSLLLARHLSHPIRRVRDASKRLAAGDLDARVPESARPGDDIAALAHDFNRMAERLQAVLQARNQLLRDISHELRSPLARLQVAVELGRRHADAAALDRMEREVERMDQLIGALLGLARLDAGTTALASERVDLHELLQEICLDAQFEAQTEDKRVHLQGVPASMDGDPALLHSAFDNIIRNAIRHTPPGTTVDVVMAIAGSTLTVAVTDAGPGVPAHRLEDIFDPFVRVAHARERDSGGHGLGLAIARRAIERHGGQIRAAAGDGAGLVVTVHLAI